ncbi:hypothetical protein K466DRAFT_604180 [Polyporus arcularius HHB13444]|uniref:Uncharacterized protein n=1 Tax=Polyporus arcularius HHB13444 TaxID=1314778 RepID=A0A5C3NZ66_9APHY|nr:hypothetical protein K466DRAFT_604180 [Polyporus arcularius HHB13444]
MSTHRVQPIPPPPQPSSPVRGEYSYLSSPLRHSTERHNSATSRREDDVYRSERNSDGSYRREDHEQPHFHRERHEYQNTHSQPHDTYDTRHGYSGAPRDSRSRSPIRRGESIDDRGLPPHTSSHTPRHPPFPSRPRSPPRNSGIMRRGLSAGDDAESDADPDTADMPPSERYKGLIKDIYDNKRNKWAIPNKRSLAGQLQKYARFVPRKFGGYIDLGRVVQDGILFEGGPPPRFRVPESSMSAELRERLADARESVEVFDWFKETVAFFSDIIPILARKPEDILTLGAFMDTHAKQAMATDKRNILKEWASFVGPVKVSDTLTIPQPVGVQATNKAFFGWESNWATAQLIRPDALPEFEEDPTRYRLMIRGNEIQVDHNDNPVFLYDPEAYDPENILEGLCRHPAHLKAVRTILTSPGSVYLAPGMKSAGRGSVSDIYKCRAIEPAMIAYVAALIRNILSSCPRWVPDDGAFKGRLFFRRLVNLFNTDNDPEDTWATETLAWWNSNVFGDYISNRNPTARRPGGSRSDDEILKAQRVARAAARMATASQARPSPTSQVQLHQQSRK